MPEKIYGVDPTKKFTPKDVREAIIRCFQLAHNDVMDKAKLFLEDLPEKEFEKIKNLNVRQMVRKYFQLAGHDYNNPTPEALVDVCEMLKKYAANFRTPGVINKHYGEIMALIKKLKEKND